MGRGEEVYWERAIHWRRYFIYDDTCVPIPGPPRSTILPPPWGSTPRTTSANGHTYDTTNSVASVGADTKKVKNDSRRIKSHNIRLFKASHRILNGLYTVFSKCMYCGVL